MASTTRGLLVALGVLLIAAFGFSILTGGMMGPAMMEPGLMMGRRGWAWGLGMGLGGLAMLAFWGALIVGVVVLTRALGGGPGRRWHVSPIDVLKRRYAAGEITREQYEQIRQDLERE